MAWGIYDEFGHTLLQDPSKGPDKSILHDLDEYKCDICNMVVTTSMRLSNHQMTEKQ